MRQTNPRDTVPCVREAAFVRPQLAVHGDAVSSGGEEQRQFLSERLKATMPRRYAAGTKDMQFHKSNPSM
jgi:hypothetical protein